MKALLFAAAAAAATAFAAPASAATPYHHRVQQDRIAQRIERGLERGVLTWREARVLRADLRDIARLEARYRYTGGLNRWETRDLATRLQTLEARVRYERRDDDRRYAHDDWRDGRHDGDGRHYGDGRKGDRDRF
jgi:hypothetical protein